MRLPHIALAVLLTAIWGFNFIAVHLALKELSPQLLVFVRFVLVSMPMIFLVKRPDVPLKLLVMYGLVMFAIQFTFMFTGMYLGMSPGLASLLMQTQVFFTIFLAFMFMSEEPNVWQMLGAIVAFSGMGVVAMHLDSSITLYGFIFTISAAALWGCGNFISKRVGKVNMFSFVSWASLIAWPPLALLSLYIDGIPKIVFQLEHVSPVSVASIFYIVYPATLFAFATWSWLLSKYPAAVVAPFTLLVPVFGMLSSALFLHEPLTQWKLVAAFLVISGLCINSLMPQFIALMRQRELELNR